MTLRGRLVGAIVVACVLAFAGTLGINIRNTRAFLERQLGAQVQGTATSLALSLTPGMLHQDLPLMDSTVNAVFDPNLFRQIVVSTVDGDPLIKREAPSPMDGVPSWYVELVPLLAPVGEAQIPTEGQQTARVYVHSNLTYAYHDLWRTAVETFWWCLGAVVVLILSMARAVPRYLKPLRRLEVQARAIGRGEFSTEPELPQAQELHPLAVAMGNMAHDVQIMLAERGDRVDALGCEAPQDPTTELHNRRDLEAAIRDLPTSGEGKGALYLIDFAGSNGGQAPSGRSLVRELLGDVSRELHQCSAELHNSTVARLGELRFAILAPDTSPDQATAFAQELREQLERFCGHYDREQPSLVSIGVSCYNLGDPGALLTQAEMALHTAESRISSGRAIFEHTGTGPETSRGVDD